MSPNSYLNEPPRCGYQGDGPAALPPCVRHRGHLGQHDHAGVITNPCGHVFTGGGFAKTQHRCTLRARHGGQHRQDPGGYVWSDHEGMEAAPRPGGNLQGYLEDLVTGGVLQTPAASPYRSEGFKIYRTASGVAFLAALATSEHEAQLLVGGTTADKLWRDDRQQLLDAADAKLADLRQRAERIEIERSKWMGRHGELAGAALHMLRRLNTIVGDRDAAEFTRAAATEAVDKLLDQLKVTNGANLALSERVEQLEEHLKASREAAEVDRKALESLRMNSQCPHLMPAVTEPGSLVLSIVERKCVRVNGHSGAHIRTDGAAW